MPFKSKAQAKWMFAKKPEMAGEWASKTKDMSSLPKKAKSGLRAASEKACRKG